MPVSPPSRPRILVIDDEPSIPTLIRIYFRREGFEVACADNGSEGLRQFDLQPFDLVIVDRQMPGMSGDEVATAIKGRSPQTPIILMTGNPGDKLDPTRFDAILPKPFSDAQLLATMKEVIASKHRGPS